MSDIAPEPTPTSPPDEPVTAAAGDRATRKERVGLVVGDKQEKTIVVAVDRRTTHPLYAKTLQRSKNYQVHDEADEAGEGDVVRIAETRPISRTKRWRLVEVVEKAK